MRQCKTCKNKLDDSKFIKCDKFWDGKSIIKTFYKLCDGCRLKGRIANNKRKLAKSAQAKTYYVQYKEEVSKKNKEWRKANKEKLKKYEQSSERKEFHKQWLINKKQEDPSRFIYYSAKQRSKASNIIFNITKQDVLDVYPRDNKCPMLGLVLKVNIEKTKENSPSLDRIIPEKGYVKGNIIVISHKANRIKNNASLDDLEKIVEYLKLELKTISLLEKLGDLNQGTL